MVAEQLDFLSGRAVQEIRIWGPFRLVFDDEATPPMYLDVEGPAVLAHGERTSDINFFTDGHPAESAALLELLWKRVVVSSIATGVLSLSFDSGAVLRAL